MFVSRIVLHESVEPALTSDDSARRMWGDHPNFLDLHYAGDAIEDTSTDASLHLMSKEFRSGNRTRGRAGMSRTS